MPRYSERFRQALEEADLETILAISKVEFPELPPLSSLGEAEVAMHMARTSSEHIQFRYRAYSHAWLRERSFESKLPDHLRPRAERIYPVIVPAVGIAIKTPVHRRELGVAIVDAMSEIVQEHWAHKEYRTEIVRPRMMEAREKIRRI